MKKNPEITNATRNKLIQAFCKLYKEKPITKITIKEITDIAGYNRSTFYQYFEDIFALLEYIEDEMIETGLEKINEIDLDALNFNEQFVFTLSEFFVTHDYYSVILSKTDIHSDFFNKLKSKAMPNMIKRFKISDDNKLAVLAIEFYLTGILTLLNKWIENYKEIPIEELGTLLHGIWYDGLLKQLKG